MNSPTTTLEARPVEPAAAVRPLRILWLCKRRYMRKDVILDRYARLYELPLELARRGHEVHGICLNYRGRGPAIEGHARAAAGRLEWRSLDLGRLVWPGLARWRRTVLEHVARWRPDIVVGASDSLHVALAHHVARRSGVPFAVDLYDNFESFGLTRVPGLRRAYHAALAAAAAVTCVSEPLRRLIADRHAGAARAITLESTIDPARFRPHPRAESRAALGLPLEGKLIGTAGALSRERGTAALYAAYEALRRERSGVALALAGSRPDSLPLPHAADVYFLGELPHARIPQFFSALDVAVICLRDDPFGRYAFPQKAYEIVGCGAPLVAPAVGAMAELLAPWPDSLYRPDDAADLLRCLERQLAQPTPPTIEPPSWAAQAARLEAALVGAVTAAPAGAPDA
jgi:glycosyltransferase involved in cell wall biosynthesis